MRGEGGRGGKDMFVKAIFDSILHTKVRGNDELLSSVLVSLAKNLNKIESSPAPKDWMRGSTLFRIGPVDAHNAGITGIGLRRQRQGYQTPSPLPPRMKMTG